MHQVEFSVWRSDKEGCFSCWQGRGDPGDAAPPPQISAKKLVKQKLVSDF